MSHKSVRILAKNGKRRNSNKSQYLQFRRSMLGGKRIGLSERQAEKIFKEHYKQIKVKGTDHVYLYGLVHFLYHEINEFGAEEEFEHLERKTQNFGSFHIPLQDLYENVYEWYKSVDQFVEEIKDFFNHESVEIVSYELNLVVRHFK